MGTRTQRIRAIDTLRGISILYMIVGHAAEFWLRGKDIWFPTLIPVTFGMIGSSMFIFISGISLTLSYNAKKRKAQTDPHYFPINANLDFLVKTLCILGFAILYNLIASTILLYGTTIWIWFVLLSISIGRLCCFPFLKYNPWVRVIIAFLFFFFTDYLFTTLSTSQDLYPLYYFLFNGTRLDYPFPFFGFIFLGSAMGSWISNFDLSSSDGNNYNQRFTGYSIIFGLILIILGISLGLELIYAQDSFARGYTNYINRNPFFQIEGIPQFLLRATTAWGIYCSGFHVIILTVFLHINKRNYSESLNNKPRGVVIFGQNSLTIYMFHYIIFLVYNGGFPIPFYFIAAPSVAILIYIIMWFWVYKGNRKGTIEWLMRKSVNSVNKYFPRNKT